MNTSTGSQEVIGGKNDDGDHRITIQISFSIQNDTLMPENISRFKIKDYRNKKA
jgi:hypothetical protein